MLNVVRTIYDFDDGIVNSCCKKYSETSVDNFIKKNLTPIGKCSKSVKEYRCGNLYVRDYGLVNNNRVRIKIEAI